MNDDLLGKRGNTCHKGPVTEKVFENMAAGKRPLWNVNDVATFLGVSTRTIRDLVYRRRIPYRKVGRCVRFSPEEIERWTLPKNEE